MKRIIILIDGTWNLEAKGANTNLGLLDPKNTTLTGTPLILAQSADGIVQEVYYHCGVGADETGLGHDLAGIVGTGLKQLVLTAYQTIASHFEHGDDVIILGFSRGAYAARALAGMIGASGIVIAPTETNKETVWANYRTKPEDRMPADPTKASAGAKAMTTLWQNGEVHSETRVKCVGVWETVGSYGVPAGFGDLSQIGRYAALLNLGFHDTSFGDHVEIGLHALGVDERRRPFVPTFWTIPKGQKPKGRVEQNWFAGDHGGVGGGHPDPRLSNEALIWMIARLQKLAGVQFDTSALNSLSKSSGVDGEVYDSTVGWLLDHWAPHYRTVLSPDAIEHGALWSSHNPAEEHINERVHWSLIEKHGRPCTVFGEAGAAYMPKNYPASIPHDKIAEITDEERAIWALK